MYLSLAITVFTGCVPEHQPDPGSCNLTVGNQVYRLTSSRAECEGLYLASRFVPRHKLYRLLAARSHSVDRFRVLDEQSPLSITYRTDENVDVFARLEGRFRSDRCETFDFFGIRLHGFNAVDGPTPKANNLDFIVKYFTTLILTSNRDHFNPLAGRVTNAFAFISESQVEYHDASVPEACGETAESVRCRGPGGSGNFQWRNGRPAVFLCARMFEPEAMTGRRLHGAAILYHEANHTLQGGHLYVQPEDRSDTLEQLRNQPYQSRCERIDPDVEYGKRDQDLNSVYGAHIAYLFSVSDNETLSCALRRQAFSQAEEMLKLRICQKPHAPSHGYVFPACD